MKTIFIIIITASLAVAGTWLVIRRMAPESATGSSAVKREPVFYQSAMHPWIKSDKPGRCTICGMELTPVYAGEKGFDESGGDNIVALTQTQIQVLHVETATAKVAPLTRTLQVAGMIDDDARRHRLISAYVDGRVDKLFANYLGVDVTAGEPLANIYSPSLLQAEREYRQLDGALKTNTGLRLQQMGLTEKQVGEVQNKPASELTSEILAPLSGTVVSQDIYEGQYVTAGQKLFEIADFSIMWFMFRAYEQDLPWIKIGQVVQVTTPSKPGKIFEGKVTFINPNFDDVTRSTSVRVELPNPVVDGQRELLHKLYADGAVQIADSPVLTIPKSAVIQTGADAVVYIDQDGGAYAQTVVKIGRRGDALVEILSGLKVGDKVVTNGNLLIDGQAEMNRAFMTPVSTEKPAPAADLNEAQGAAIQSFITVADAMAAALSADDLPAFIKASEPAMAETDKLIKSMEGIEGQKEKLDALDGAKHFHGADDLKAARIAFHPFIIAATALLEPMRSAKGFPEMQIWECPMVDDAIPGAPKKGQWIQTNKRAGHNPFFGAEMLECGKEIQP